MPSITGLVASFELTKVVTSSLSQEEIESLESEVMLGLNAAKEDIVTTGNYSLHESLNLILFLLSGIFNLWFYGCFCGRIERRRSRTSH